jgi:hypothetical protein
MFRLTNLGND